ncbi:MAG: ComF family protein [Bacteroidetes bacterium]|nr:ComF family protein [Bacteroidota bacterium]
MAHSLPIYVRLSTTVLHNFVTTVVNFIFPPTCIVCSRPLPNLVCQDCWEALPSIANDPALFANTLRKLTTDSTIQTLVSCYIFEYQGPLQQIIHALKYRGYSSVGIQLGELLGTSIRESGLTADLIIPVPLHKRKQRERGYNQAECIAKGMAKVLTIPYNTSILTRHRYTKSQTKLTVTEREYNMKNAFSVNPQWLPCLSHKTCIVVDDVITTGATIKACANALSQAQPASIIAASVAIAHSTF